MKCNELLNFINLNYDNFNKENSIQNFNFNGFSVIRKEESWVLEAKKRCKIRRRNLTKWKDMQRKCLKNSGKPYTNKKGKEMPKKKMRAACKCSKNCSDNIKEEEREHIFKCYWRLGTHEQQWDFISKYVTSHAPFRIKASGPNRSSIYVYTLPKINDNMETTVTVCRTMFLNTLSVSEKTVRTVFRKINTSDNKDNIIDMRGRHHNRPRRTK